MRRRRAGTLVPRLANLRVDQNITNLVALMQRAANAGYTQMLPNDSKFSRLGTMDAHYFQNVGVLKQTATNLNLDIVRFFTILPCGLYSVGKR